MRLPLTASKYSSKLTQSRPPSVSLISLDYGLPVRTIMASQCISPNSLNHGLQVYLQPCLITASKCIYKLARSQSWSASRSSLNHGLLVYLQIRSISTSKCISNLAPSKPRSISLNSPDRHFQAHLELLSRTACSQSRNAVCRWVAI